MAVNSSEHSWPAFIGMLWAPPGCSAKYGFVSYTTPFTAIQQSVSESWGPGPRIPRGAACDGDAVPDSAGVVGVSRDDAGAVGVARGAEGAPGAHRRTR